MKIGARGLSLTSAAIEHARFLLILPFCNTCKGGPDALHTEKSYNQCESTGLHHLHHPIVVCVSAATELHAANWQEQAANV